jgi:hypothetical protein
MYTVNKVNNFSILSRNVTNQSLPGWEQFNYSRPGRVWLVTSRTGKSLTFFYSVMLFYFYSRILILLKLWMTRNMGALI